MNVHFSGLRFARRILRQSRWDQFKCSHRILSDFVNGDEGTAGGDRLSSSDGSLEYSASREDFKWVERLLPPSRIPFPPRHESYPTPSGWVAPSDVLPEKPYFVNRTKYHEFAIYEQQKPKKSGRWLTLVKNIEGDIKALEKELIDVVKTNVPYDPAMRVNEATQTIWIKGLHKEAVENYLYKQGF